MWGAINATSQDGYQALILAISLICVPVMLLVKPLYAINKMKKHNRHGNRAR